MLGRPIGNDTFKKDHDGVYSVQYWIERLLCSEEFIAHFAASRGLRQIFTGLSDTTDADMAQVKRGPYGAIPYYNVTRLRQTRTVNGLALVFFMGVGDYLMATPLIAALHQAHPDLPIWAYASSSADQVNSPLLAQLLAVNPLVHRTGTYRGRPRGVWTDYDISDALRQIPDDFAVLPVIYDTDHGVVHRVTSVLETFGLPVELPVPPPIAYKATMSDAAQALLAAILDQHRQDPTRDIVCSHFEARSSGYIYPHIAALTQHLIEQGFQVVSFSPTGVINEHLTEIDIATISVPDSIEIIRALRAAHPRLSIVSVNSLMWPISAALGIPNLGLHTFRDDAVHQYVYANIHVMTQHLYPKLSPSRLFLAPGGTYDIRDEPGQPAIFTDYKPEYVAHSLRVMLAHALPAAEG